MIDPGGSTPVRIASGLVALGLIAAACAKNQQPPVSVAGAMGFDQNATSIANGPIPAADPGLACGSRTDSFGVELLHKKPTAATVLREWGEIIPGQQMFVSGKVANVVFSSGDLTFTHPFNLDFTFDVKPDPAFAKLAQQVGTGEREGGPPGTIHMEISQGLIPHSDPSSLNDFLLGFIPSVGDRVAAYGRWIIDCGHDDYHSEIHPTTFLAFSHTEGSSTVAHTFYNPYYETQLYTPNPSLPAELENPNRLLDNETRPSPPISSTRSFAWRMSATRVRPDTLTISRPTTCWRRTGRHRSPGTSARPRGAARVGRSPTRITSWPGPVSRSPRTRRRSPAV